MSGPPKRSLRIRILSGGYGEAFLRNRRPPLVAVIAMRRTSQGFLAGISAAVGYGLMPLFVLPLIARGMTVDTILFYRFFLGGAALGLVMLFRREPLYVSPRNLGILALLSLFYAMAAQSVLLGYLFLPSGVVTTIHFLYPVVVAALMMLFFKERKSLVTFLAIALAVGGVALLSWGGEGGGTSLAGVAVVLWSAVSLALFIVGMEWAGKQGMHGMRVAFYLLIFGSLPSLFVAVAAGHFSYFPDWKAAGIGVSLALVTATFSVLTLNLSIRLIGSTMTSIVGAMEPVTAVVMGIIVFGESLTFALVIGILLILAAVGFVMLAPQVERLAGRLRGGT